MRTQIEGVLEIQHERGRIVFQTTEADTVRKYGRAFILIIEGLAAPIPDDGETITIYVQRTDWIEPDEQVETKLLTS